MAAAETLRQVRETRRELARLNKDFENLYRTGQRSGSRFGQAFKKAAVFGLKTFAGGVIHGLGERWAQSLGREGSKSGKNFGKRFKKTAQREVSDVSRGLKFNLGALPIIGAGVLAAGIAAQLTTSLKSAFEQERLNISFNALSQDGAGGARIFEELREQALRTGVEIEGMASSLQRFLALGFAEEDALQLNRSLLDIAGSLGMTTREAALLGTALAQVKAKGVASMEELRQQIAEKGVPVFEVLAQKIGVTEAEIIKMVSRGEIGADTVIEAFQNLEGPLARFRGGAERMGNSAGGLFARLKQEVLDLKREFGEELLPELKPLLMDAISMIRGFKDEASAFGARMADVLGNVRAMFQALDLRELFVLAALTFKSKMLDGVNVMNRALAALISTIADGSLEKALERSALKFKEVMLQTMSEISIAMATAMPENAAGRKLAKPMRDAALAMSVGASAAASERAGKEDGQNFGDAYKKAFERAQSNLSLSRDESLTLDRLNKIWMARRSENRANQGSQDSTSPAQQGSRMTSTAGAAGGEGLIAGGLANALSRISGGPNTILLTRQLKVQEATQRATESTAGHTEKAAGYLRKMSRGGMAPRFT